MSDRVVLSRHLDLHQGGMLGNTAAPIITITGQNKSGGSVARGDVVIWDTTNATPDVAAFTTTTTGNDPLVMGMVYDVSVANGAIGKVQVWGPTTALKVDGTTDIAKGDFIGSFTTVKIGQKTTGQGAFAIAQEAYTTNDSAGVIDAFINCWALTNNNSVSGLDWDNVWTDAVHSHASNAEGSTLTWANALAATNAGDHTHASTTTGGTLSSSSAFVNDTISRARLIENALDVFSIPFTEVLGADGAELAISETGGDFYRSLGTNQMLILGEISNGTVGADVEASVGWFRFCLPSNYVTAGDITIRAGVDVVGAGALGTCTIDFSAYLQDGVEGSVGSDLVVTAATAISKTAANKDFTVTATGLVAGDILVIKMTTSVDNTDSTNIQAQISRLAVLCDVK